MRESDNDGRADLAEYVEQDAFASLNVVGEDSSESLIVDVFATQHLIDGVGIEHPHTITPIRRSNVEGEGGVVLEDISETLDHTLSISRLREGLG